MFLPLNAPSFPKKFAANPIPAVSEFIAQLQILELLDNVSEEFELVIHLLSLPGAYDSNFLVMFFPFSDAKL